MSELTRIHFLQYGKHSAANDWTTTPGSLKFLRPTNNPVIDTGYENVARDYQTGNNENLAALRGIQRLSISDVSAAIHGLSGGGAGDATDSSSLDTCLSEAFECLTGSTATNNAGDTSDGTQGAADTLTVTGAPASPISDGGAVLIKGNSSGKYVAREVVSQSTPVADLVYQLDRTITDDSGASDPATASDVVYAARTYVVSNSVENPIHLYFDSETEGGRQKIFGAMSSASLSFPAGGSSVMNMSGIQMTKWENAAKANPTYSEPTRGNQIIVGDCPFWIKDAGGTNTLFQAFDFDLDMGNQVASRRNEGGENGVSGYVVSNRMPVLTGKIRAGALVSPDEMTQAEMEAFRGADKFSITTADIGLQMGRDAGAAAYIRMPNARLDFVRADENGQRVYQFTATASESSNQASVPGALRIHIF